MAGVIQHLTKVLDKKKYIELHNKITDNDFPWFIEKEATDTDKLVFFTHCFYKNFKVNSDYFYLIEPILDILKPVSLVNIRANCNYNRGYVQYSGWHEDRYQDKKNLEYKTAIYYVNTNNGFTELKIKKYKEYKIESIANNMSIFPANTTHRVHTQTDKDYRILININYF